MRVYVSTGTDHVASLEAITHAVQRLQNGPARPREWTVTGTCALGSRRVAAARHVLPARPLPGAQR